MNLQSKHDWHMRERRLISMAGDEESYEASINFDLSPIEKAKIYDERGEAVDNEFDRRKRFTKIQFRNHVEAMFKQHYKQNFPDEKKSWEGSMEGIAGEVLDKVTAEIFDHTEEFQRGTADYFKAYEKCWRVYQETVAEISSDHPLLETGAFKQGKAPGIYLDGKLVAIPRKLPGNVGKRKGLSGNARARLNELSGLPRDPEKARVTQKVEEAKKELGAYGWAEKFRKENPDAGSFETDKALEKAAMERAHLNKTEADLYRTGADRFTAPEEQRETATGLDGAVDFRYRQYVFEKMNETLGLEVSNVRQFNRKVPYFMELKEGSDEFGTKQVIEFEAIGGMYRGKRINPRRGVLLIEPDKENPNMNEDIIVIEYEKADDMMSRLVKNPFVKPLWENANSDYFSGEELAFIRDRVDAEKLNASHAPGYYACDEMVSILGRMEHIKAVADKFMQLDAEPAGTLNGWLESKETNTYWTNNSNTKQNAMINALKGMDDEKKYAAYSMLRAYNGDITGWEKLLPDT